jgi:cytochrome c peroxidase
MLYYDARLSKNHDVSCNSCHDLQAFGVDGEATSPGHRGQRGGRNSPTVYNAALHTAQFWDGREPDVEAQAKRPVLNPIEMAAPSEAHVVEVLESIPGYAPAFEAAFPGEAPAISYDNIARSEPSSAT